MIRRDFLATALATSPALTGDDARFADAIDRYLTAHDKYHSFLTRYNAQTGISYRQGEILDKRHAGLLKAMNDERYRLIAAAYCIGPIDPPPPFGSYTPARPFYRRQVGRRLLLLTAHAVEPSAAYDGGVLDPGDTDHVEIIIVDLDPI